ncbi:MAG: hypothetical protein ACK4NR_09310 [Micavibrio sp.]
MINTIINHNHSFFCGENMSKRTDGGLTGREREDLERRYGPGFAQKIIDSMPDHGPVNYLDVKEVVDIVVRFRGYVRVLARQYRHARDRKGMADLRCYYLGAETAQLEDHLAESYRVYRQLQADCAALQRRYLESLQKPSNDRD